MSQVDHEDCQPAKVSHEIAIGLVMVMKFFWHARIEVTVRQLAINIRQDAAVKWMRVEHTILNQVVAWTVDQTGDWREGDPRAICWVHS